MKYLVQHAVLYYTISVISVDILNNLQNNLSKCLAVNLALDESTDIKDKPQLAIFVRYGSKDLEVVEELLDRVTLKNTTRGCDIKKALDGLLQKNAVLLGNIVSLCYQWCTIYDWHKTRAHWAIKCWHIVSWYLTCTLHYSQRTFSSQIFLIPAYYAGSSKICELHSLKCQNTSHVKYLKRYEQRWIT